MRAMKRTAFVAHMTNPARVFCVAGVIGLAAVLGDSIPSSAHNSKKNRRRKRESALRQRYENVRSFFSARRRVYADAFLISGGGRWFRATRLSAISDIRALTKRP